MNEPWNTDVTPIPGQNHGLWLCIFVYISSDGSNEKSLESIGKPAESETSSLAEYEETDTAKFNEDGSFIGQYGVAEKKEETIDPEITEDTVPFSSIVWGSNA